jgi:hypothetical protein
MLQFLKEHSKKNITFGNVYDTLKYAFGINEYMKYYQLRKAETLAFFSAYCLDNKNSSSNIKYQYLFKPRTAYMEIIYQKYPSNKGGSKKIKGVATVEIPSYTVVLEYTHFNAAQRVRVVKIEDMFGNEIDENEYICRSSDMSDIIYKKGAIIRFYEDCPIGNHGLFVSGIWVFNSKNEMMSKTAK